ncbi:hypothetical protein AVEN_76154-1 [Araneus ventricosus]|uniref:Uncharacterized protein n=1 Tax=Araneus ventricosus TaxID=182803 RepID=A0A4Y2E993_ARAVE|nr:hypothetical protein AVEN_76154-1 [Araneus ventricosus]
MDLVIFNCFQMTPKSAPPSSEFRHISQRVFGPKGFTDQGSSRSEADTLPPGHRGLKKVHINSSREAVIASNSLQGKHNFKVLFCTQPEKSHS